MFLFARCFIFVFWADEIKIEQYASSSWAFFCCIRIWFLRTNKYENPAELLFGTFVTGQKKNLVFVLLVHVYFSFISEICECSYVCVIYVVCSACTLCTFNIQNVSFIFRSLLPRYKAPARFTYCKKKKNHGAAFTFSLYIDPNGRPNKFNIYEFHKHSKWNEYQLCSRILRSVAYYYVYHIHTDSIKRLKARITSTTAAAVAAAAKSAILTVKYAIALILHSEKKTKYSTR